MIKRRTLLTGLGVTAGLVGLGGLEMLRATDQQAIIQVLNKRLSYLKLDQEGVKRFADDLVSRNLLSKYRLRALAASGPLYTRLALNGHDRFTEAIRHTEERIVTFYLMSTDFFKNRADMSRTVMYLGYYDPLQTLEACSSAFGRPVEGPPPAA